MGFIGEVQWLCDAPWTERRELPCFSTTARSVEKR
jgi:hypothetical protein